MNVRLSIEGVSLMVQVELHITMPSLVLVLDLSTWMMLLVL